jgi:hypothetical protein
MSINNVPEMSVGSCITSGIIKADTRTVNTGMSMGATDTITVNGMNISNLSQPTPITTMPMNNGTYMVGDLQGHQTNLTSVITQMSDNELINYINPSCFEQNLM